MPAAAYWDFLHLTRSCAGIGFVSTSGLQVQVINTWHASEQAEIMWIPGQENTLLSSIPWFQVGVELGIACGLIATLRSGSDSA